MAHGCDHKTEDTLLGGADTETTLKRNRLTIDSASHSDRYSAMSAR